MAVRLVQTGESQAVPGQRPAMSASQQARTLLRPCQANVDMLSPIGSPGGRAYHQAMADDIHTQLVRRIAALALTAAMRVADNNEDLDEFAALEELRRIDADADADSLLQAAEPASRRVRLPTVWQSRRARARRDRQPADPLQRLI